MKIALVSTCAVPTPPRAYGGIELFVATLAQELVDRGHDVVVYATGDSRPAGLLRHVFAHPIWPPDFALEAQHARFAWRDVAKFAPDIVHVNLPDGLPQDHVDTPVVVTIHHPRIERLVPMYLRRPSARRVAISRRQAELVPELAPMAVIHHGVDVDAYDAHRGDGGYVAFLGRIGPEKAPHIAIDAAVSAGVPLVIGGPNWSGDARYDDYFHRDIAPRLARHASMVQWRGELDHADKVELLGGACALLMPSAWHEPFGLVMIEAMLVGTPVIAFDSGSAPEIVDTGVTGFVVGDTDGMAAAIVRARGIDRRTCRAHARRRFGARRMADDYEALYRRCVRSARPGGTRRAAYR